MTAQTPRPTPLVWLYVLVTVSVACVGVAAGNLFWAGNLSTGYSFARALTLCDRRNPSALSPTGRVLNHVAYERYSSCLQDAQQVHGLMMLTGVAALMAAATVLALVIPWRDVRRLRGRPGRRRAEISATNTRQRFAALCDEYGLSDRRRPRLLVAGPPVRQAFTVARPGGRPLVVLPMALTLPERESALEAVLQHEFGHILARDVAWVSIVRGLTWLTLPAVVIASVPALLAAVFPLMTRVPSVPVIVITRAALLAGLTTILAAALLRRREYGADRFAEAAGHGPSLASLFDPAETPGRRSLLARHPSPAARTSALLGSDSLHDATALHGLAIGAVTSIAMGAVCAMLEPFLGNIIDQWLWFGWPPTELAAITGALLLGGFVPAVLRRAAAARNAGIPAQWWRPMSGLAVGLSVGGFVTPATSQKIAIYFPEPELGLERTLVLAVATALICTGAMCVVIGFSTVGLRTGLLAAAGTIFLIGVLGSLPLVAPGLTGWWSETRVSLFWLLPHTFWPYLTLALPLIAAIAGFKDERGRRALRDGLMTTAGTVLGATSITGALCVIQSRFVLTTTDGGNNLLVEERIWVCTLAGWIVMLLLARRSNRASFPRAIAAGWAVSALSGGILFLNAALRGRHPGFWNALSDIGTPVIWVVALTLFTAPALVFSSGRARIESRPARAWPIFAGATLVSGLVAALVLNVGIPGLYAPYPSTTVADVVQPPPTTVEPALPAPEVPDTRARHPHAVLTVAALNSAARSVGPGLPSYWRSVPARTPPPTTAAPEPAACRPLAKGAFESSLTRRQVAKSETDYQTLTAPLTAPVVRSILTVTLTSYSVPIPASIFATARAEENVCPAWTTRTKTLLDTFTVNPDHETDASYGPKSWRIDYNLSTSFLHYRLPRGAAGSKLAVITCAIGHTMITVALTALAEPLDESVLRTAMADTIAAVQKP